MHMNVHDGIRLYKAENQCNKLAIGRPSQVLPTYLTHYGQVYCTKCPPLSPFFSLGQNIRGKYPYFCSFLNFLFITVYDSSKEARIPKTSSIRPAILTEN